MTKNETVYLTGFMGAGKTTSGKLLAEKLNISFKDLDVLIQEQTGKTIPDIFAEEGEKGFREREYEALKMVSGSEAVVATGGGIVETPEARDLLSKSCCFYLSVPFEELFERIEGDETRPIALLEKPKLQKRYEKRLPFYESCGKTIDCASLTPDQLSEELVKILQDARSSCGK
ncbi:shikimate kinase [Alkalicoccus luteus]|uniref:Shikimate kinase n=1 Tax=Alkalicoccus luteus TaxID=1237094 RepID=A0A969PY05_9BACI|nr:shikimate kinase [Alkalicoccus luteus]NJP37652.1 shikimate kinase [Alkalicoccus luteus]